MCVFYDWYKDAENGAVIPQFQTKVGYSSAVAKPRQKLVKLSTQTYLKDLQLEFYLRVSFLDFSC